MLFSKGHRPPYKPPPYPTRMSAGAGLHERKLAAWALTIGARVPLDLPSEGRRRGRLPDIDLSGAGPDPGYRSPMRRLIDWLGEVARPPTRRPAPAATVSGAVCEGLGTGAPASYIDDAGRAVPNRASQTGEDGPGDLQERALKRAA